MLTMTFECQNNYSLRPQKSGARFLPAAFPLCVTLAHWTAENPFQRFGSALPATRTVPSALEVLTQSSDLHPQALDTHPQAQEVRPHALDAHPHGQDLPAQAREARRQALEACPQALETGSHGLESLPQALEACPQASEPRAGGLQPPLGGVGSLEAPETAARPGRRLQIAGTAPTRSEPPHPHLGAHRVGRRVPPDSHLKTPRLSGIRSIRSRAGSTDLLYRPSAGVRDTSFAEPA